MHADPASSPRLPWLLALPKLGILLLLAALFLLFWLLHRSEAESARNALIKDVLWLEQSLRFHLDGNREKLTLIAADMAHSGEATDIFRSRTAQLLKNSPELSGVVWLDARQQPRQSLPGNKETLTLMEPSGAQPLAKAFDTAQKLALPVYSEPFMGTSNKGIIHLLVPIYSETTLLGMLVATYPLDQLLASQIPWWFAEKYKVEIIDDNDLRYASKTHIDGEGSVSYQLPFDPPGQGLKLRISAYPGDAPAVQEWLAILIFILAAGVFWSLWLIRHQILRRTLAEEALRSEHAFRSAMEDSLTVGMRARDLNGTIIYVNPAFCRMTGFSAEELIGRPPPMPYWAPEVLEETISMHEAVMAGRAPVDGFEILFRRKNGERFHALVYEARLIDGKGVQTGWMASVVDITERKRAEELARQQQAQLQFTARLVTMGEMASTLAHELNQPLAAIAGYNSGCLNLLAQDNTSVSDLKPALEKVGAQAQRAGKIIRRVQDFVRRSEPKLADCDLGEVIEDCLGFIEPEVRKQQVRIETDCQSLPGIQADRVLLEQVLLNLIRNAIDAMQKTPVAERRLNIRAQQNDQEIRIDVSDTGCGIAPEIRERLFDAFFTTKPDGMGIGLSICRSIIEFHRGRLWVEDVHDTPTGTGTRFSFTLPRENA